MSEKRYAGRALCWGFEQDTSHNSTALSLSALTQVHRYLMLGLFPCGVRHFEDKHLSDTQLGSIAQGSS